MKRLALLSTCLALAACAPLPPQYRLGQFTAASSFNVRNMSYDQSTAVRVTGMDCHKVGVAPNDARLQRAMDAAIREGQGQGVGGDLLVNVRIDQIVEHRPGFLGLPEPHLCLKVEGDLVALKK